MTPTRPFLLTAAAMLFAAPALGAEPLVSGSSDAPAAQNEAAAGADDATSTVQEIVEDTRVDAHGAAQAATGGAAPKENWFGCKNSETTQQDACELGNGEETAETDGETDGETWIRVEPVVVSGSD